MAQEIETHEMPEIVEEGESGPIPNFRPRLRVERHVLQICISVHRSTNAYDHH